MSGKSPLTQQAIVRAALDLIDSEGIQKLSMRRLAEQFGVTPMALYHHVPDKEALLGLVVDEILGGVRFAPLDSLRSPAERLIAGAHAFRSALIAHPHAIPLIAERQPTTTAQFGLVESLLALLFETAMTPQQASLAVNAIGQFILGASSSYASQLAATNWSETDPAAKGLSLDPAQFPHMARVLAEQTDADFEAEFDVGIRALVFGLLAQFNLGEDHA